MRAIGLLSFWKLRNGLRTLLTDPRKLIPLLLVLIWIGLSVLSVFLTSINSRRTTHFPPMILPSVLQSGVFLIFILLGFISIDTGLGDGLLAFAMSDVDYLLPSPIPRRLILAYRLPAIFLSSVFSGGFVLVFMRVFLQNIAPPHRATPGGLGWSPVAALILCIGIYLNLAMYISVRFPNRSTAHRALLVVMGAFGASIALVGWREGLSGFSHLMNLAWLKWIFWPSYLATQAFMSQYLNQDAWLPIRWLGPMYVLSFIPMFASRANFYEQSIVSAERISAIRSAAKGGYASLLAAKAAKSKYRSDRDFTVPAFGHGAGALFWAHMCAAVKKPTTNFVAPAAGGALTGFLGGLIASHQPAVGLVCLAGVAAYLGFGFMGSARTASEASVRRRDLIAPIPVQAWKGVIANLGVPWLAVGLFSIGVIIGYAASSGPHLLMVSFAAIFIYAWRFGSRMILQYIVVIGYPDFADKVQQFLGMGVYFVLAMPFLIFEGILCIPAIVLQSPWLALVVLSLAQVPIFFALLYLSGRATERALATGEPVNLFRLFLNRV